MTRMGRIFVDSLILLKAIYFGVELFTENVILFNKLMRICTLTLLCIACSFGMVYSQWTKIYQTGYCDCPWTGFHAPIQGMAFFGGDSGIVVHDTTIISPTDTISAT